MQSGKQSRIWPECVDVIGSLASLCSLPCMETSPGGGWYRSPPHRVIHTTPRVHPTYGYSSPGCFMSWPHLNTSLELMAPSRINFMISASQYLVLGVPVFPSSRPLLAPIWHNRRRGVPRGGLLQLWKTYHTRHAFSLYPNKMRRNGTTCPTRFNQL